MKYLPTVQAICNVSMDRRVLLVMDEAAAYRTARSAICRPIT